MKKNIVLLVPLVLALLVSGGIYTYFTEATSPRPIKEKSKISKKFLNSFMSVSLSNRAGLESSFLYYLPLNIAKTEERDRILHPEMMKKYYPWLYPLVYPEALPRVAVINKWIKPVRISLNFPNNFEPYDEITEDSGFSKISLFGHNGNGPASMGEDNYGRKKYEGYKKDVVPEIEIIISELKEYTGLDIEYVENESDVEIYSNFRIILPGSRSEWKTNTIRMGSRSSYKDGIHRQRYRKSIERYIQAAVPFTPQFMAQVDGYFVPNKDNEIEFSVCYLWYGHDINLIKLALRECMLRSLGLPAVQISEKQSLLYPWNDPEVSEKDNWEIIHDAINASGKGFSFDQEMLRLLYSEKIKPGMNYLDISKLYFNQYEQGEKEY